MTEELDLRKWLRAWIHSAPEEEVREKFIQAVGRLNENEIACSFYYFLVEDYPDKQEEIASLIEIPF